MADLVEKRREPGVEVHACSLIVTNHVHLLLDAFGADRSIKADGRGLTARDAAVECSDRRLGYALGEPL